MKILWTANLIPRGAAGVLGIKSDVLGGWVEAMADQLRQIDGVSLAIAEVEERTLKHRRRGGSGDVDVGDDSHLQPRIVGRQPEGTATAKARQR